MKFKKLENRNIEEEPGEFRIEKEKKIGRKGTKNGSSIIYDQNLKNYQNTPTDTSENYEISRESFGMYQGFTVQISMDFDKF